MNKRQAKRLALRAAYEILASGTVPDHRTLNAGRAELGIRSSSRMEDLLADDERFERAWDDLIVEIYWRGHREEES